MFSLIIGIVLLVVNSQASDVFVNNSAVLGEYLCKGHLKANDTLIITPTVLNIDTGFEKFCIVQDVVNVKITTNHLPVTLNCRPGRGGFGFFNTTNLTLVALTFRGCGTEIKLPKHIQHFTNNSVLFIGPRQRSILLFSFSRHTVVSHINIGGSYQGFGILAINALIQFELNYCIVTNDNNGHTANHSSTCNPLSTYDYSCTGSGLVFVYIDDTGKLWTGPPVDNTTLLLQNVSIHNVTNYYHFYQSLADLYGHFNNSNPILSGTGVTILFSSNLHFVNSFLSELHVSGTRASHAGALLIYYLNSNIKHPVLISDLRLEYNSVLLHEYSLSPGLTLLFSEEFQDAQVVLITWSPFVIINGYFAYNTGYKGAGMLMKAHAFSHLRSLIQLYYCTFFRNKAVVTGSAFHVETSVMKKILPRIQILLGTINATENSDMNSTYGASVFSFISPGALIVFRSSTLVRNKGSVIELYSCTLQFFEELICDENISYKGSCVFMRGTAFIQLQENMNVILRNNFAHLSGGAIYSDDAGGPSDTCSILFGLKPLYLVAKGNRASLDGDVMRLSNLYNCSIYLINQEVLVVKDNLKFFMEHLHYHPNSTTAIVSRVSQLIVCNSSQVHIKFMIYSGMVIHLPVTALDAGNHPVYTSATVTLHPHDSSSIWKVQGTNFYNLYANTCNRLSFMIVTSSLPNSGSGLLVLQSTDTSTVSVSIPLTILPCPYGFAASSGGTSKCSCSSFLLSLHPVTCIIQNGSIMLPISAWFGRQGKDNSSSEAFSYSCPTSYCTSNIYNVSLNNSLCSSGRTDVMCGKCEDGLSVVLGSDNKCHKCSNVYLLLVLVFALAGIFLVFLLFAVNIKISGGVIGGIIFYANMSSISLHTALLNNQPYTIPVKVMLSFLNLNVGFTVCFYNGMTNITKAAMQFIFPVYLCTIVLVLVILSRYSYRIANMIVGSSVQVLATVVHISFAKLLSTSAVILTSSELIVSGVNPHLVWYYDGTVDYFTGFHLVLVIVSLLVIIMVIFPYLIFTITASHLRRYPRISLYLHPLIDAYHSQYKVKYGYWFGVRQCLMVSMFVVYSILRGTRPGVMLMVNIACIGVFLIVHVMIKPFKSAVTNYVESWFIFLLFCTDLVTFYFIHHAQVSTTVQSSVISFLLLVLYLVTVLVLFVCHVSLQYKSELCSLKIFRKFYTYPLSSAVNDDEIREPLLSDS